MLLELKQMLVRTNIRKSDQVFISFSARIVIQDKILIDGGGGGR